MNILIPGANGFIGSHLCEAILSRTDWKIFALDIAQDKLENCLGRQNFHFHCGDMTVEKEWMAKHLANADVVVPLVAIATPAVYVTDPLRVFELDFEANLEIIRMCVAHGKRLLFPSTSEVYGMCPDAEFDEETSSLVTGPVHRERWIYSASKQLLDRVIYAYGKHHQLDYTLFRPFNWFGPKLDNVFNPRPGGSRVLTQFIGNILRGEDIMLVNGGEQRRAFMYIDDGISGLLKMIENKNNCAYQQIFNLGNPDENISIRELAEMLLKMIPDYPGYAAAADKVSLVTVDAEQYYGKGYQDVALRVPRIDKARQQLGWEPVTDFVAGLKKTLDYYLAEAPAGLSRRAHDAHVSVQNGAAGNL